MPFTTAQRNAWLDAIDPIYVSAHTGDPGQTGTNEVSGGSYARVQATGGTAFGAAASGLRTLGGDIDINIPAGTTVTHIGYWSAASGGTFYAFDPVTNEAFAGDGIYRVDASGTTLTISDA